jgi:hypothetical protein
MRAPQRDHGECYKETGPLRAHPKHKATSLLRLVDDNVLTLQKLASQWGSPRSLWCIFPSSGKKEHTSTCSGCTWWFKHDNYLLQLLIL